jgi:hypothetical protein
MNHDILDSLYNNETDSFVLDPYLIFINNIHDNHLEYIDVMYTDFKNRFRFTPFFLGNLKNTDLTDFIINLYQLDQTSKKQNNNLYNFKSYYTSELYISYNIIKTFLKQKTINLSLEYDIWINFCYRYSDLHELFSNHLTY